MTIPFDCLPPDDLRLAREPATTEEELAKAFSSNFPREYKSPFVYLHYWARKYGLSRAIPPGSEVDRFIRDVSKKTTRALVKCLEAAGVDYAVLGTAECCTGDTLRRGGAEDKFQALAQSNVELFSNHGVKKIIASCPHCFHTLANEYPQFGGHYEVIHHSKLIAHLLETGKLRVSDPLGKKVTYGWEPVAGWVIVYLAVYALIYTVLPFAVAVVRFRRMAL